MKQVLKTRTGAFLLILTISSLWLGSASALQLSDIKLTPGNAGPGAEFGRSIAITGGLLAVGAGAATAGTTTQAGAVYVFKRQGQAFVREAKLIAPDATPGAEFGRAVAIQGNTAVVGARFAQVGGIARVGAAYVFRKAKRSWYLEAKITSPDAAPEDNFGRALAIHGDLLVVTARKENINANDVGAAYVFRLIGGNWTLEAKLTAGDPTPGGYFGQSVAVQGDLIVVGARNANPNAAGAAYLFYRSDDQWIQTAKLTPPDGETDDQFGFTVALAGNLIAVGARRTDLPDKSDAGAAYLFALTGEGTVQVAKLSASDALAGDEFGFSLSAHGNLMAVGAHFANSVEGSAYVMPLKP